MILSDSQIRVSGMIPTHFEEHCLSGCAYEFRASEIAYRYDYAAKSSRQEVTKKHVIYPFETITVITEESVSIDDQHYLFLYSKGILFSLGLIPVCTGADPGFEGQLGISLTNISARPVVIPSKTRFIKGIFHTLDKKAIKLYRGQHGDATLSWPYPNQFHSDEFDHSAYEKHMNRFLPYPLAFAIETSKALPRYLIRMLWILTTVALLNVTSYVLVIRAPESWTSRLFDVLSLIGIAASILGLAIPLVALKGPKGNN